MVAVNSEYYLCRIQITVNFVVHYLQKGRRLNVPDKGHIFVCL
jgi:hypothetical protein